MKPFALPPYPYDLLDEARANAKSVHGRMIDLSVGTPFDPPPKIVIDALATSDTERGYPKSIGSAEYRTAVADWFASQQGVSLDPAQIGAAIGLKELVAGIPHWLRHRTPEKDTVLYPAISYPSYAMGAELAHGRAVAVPVDEDWRLDLSAIDPADADRALCLWVNSPGNPAGQLEDLEAASLWGREHGVPVFSDECYIEFTWNGPSHTILEHGTDGVVAIHSLSKRSNLAGVRAGYYAGDAELVHWLQEIRKHAGMMPAGPTQAAATAALGDQTHVHDQRERYERRLRRMIEILGGMGIDTPMPDGGFYLWAPAPNGDSWALVNQLANEAGAITAPGEFYGAAGDGHVRIALVCADDDLDEIARRLSLV
ncbi:MAG: aminotransferase class I/II-fold pyridoxal phosphate-dependent enzyme [Acidimicrobiales bacterium]